MNLQKEIEMARGKNWARIIAEKCDRICNENANDVDMFIKILNGDVFEMAQAEFSHELAQGLYDNMLMPIIKYEE